MLWPPSTIEYIATLTPPRHSVTLINDYYDYIPIDEKFDLVGISYFTATATKAYQIADSFRENNIPVVLGGYHATALPKEAKQHADSVLIGEAERIWPIIVRDYESGKPKPFYKQLKPVDISK
ncbi:MAG: cobalamin-dependent protein, partial [Candidatus Thermoplasmatota archaeon]